MAPTAMSSRAPHGADGDVIPGAAIAAMARDPISCASRIAVLPVESI
jgi:hypothetical protein